MIILSFLYNHDQSGRNIVFVQVLDRLHTDTSEVGTTDLLQILLLEGIELQINLEVWLIVRKFFREFLVFCDPDAVGIHHQIMKWPLLCSIKDLEEVRMNRRFPTRYLHHIRFSFVRTDRIEHGVDLIERFMIPSGIRACETDRTREIALISNLDDREAGMLLMIGTDSTVMGTSVDGLG